MIDYRVYTFLEVCREMNYTKAAVNLNITQPNVTQHIHWFEEQYGQKFFEYNNRRLVLTRAGELFKKTALSMVNEDRLLSRQMAQLGNERLPFSFGITRSVNEGAIKDKVIDFLQEYASDNIHFYVDNTEHLIHKLMSMEIDFAIVEGNFSKRQFDSVVLSKEKFIPVCGKDYPLSDVEFLEDLCGERLIIREEGSGTRNILENILQSRNLSYDNFKSVMEIGDISVIKMLLLQSRGISFMYETAVKKELEEGKIVSIPLKNLDINHDFCLIWPKSENFREIFEKVAKRFRQK